MRTVGWSSGAGAGRWGARSWQKIEARPCSALCRRSRSSVSVCNPKPLGPLNPESC